MTRRTVAGFSALAALLVLPAAGHGLTGVYSPSARACFDAVQTATLALETVVHAQIRASVVANLEAQTLACAGGFQCAGGPNNGAGCADSSSCGAAGGVPFQCEPRRTAGIAGTFNQARADLRAAIAGSCTTGDILELLRFSGNARCHDPSNPSNGLSAEELATCVLHGSAGAGGGPAP
ncbi:MAG: hypothetical protein SFX73_05490, partial [Kofleriaceae bacterium]|nr:hypothetical protein [Kofleriaceae bacterium]